MPSGKPAKLQIWSEEEKVGAKKRRGVAEWQTVQSFKSVRLSAPGWLAHEVRLPGFASATERPAKEKAKK